MSNNQKLIFGETNLVGALVRHEPSFQHYDKYPHFKAHSATDDLLGAIGTVIEGEWIINKNPQSTPDNEPVKDYWFRDIFWHEYGSSEWSEYLTKTIRVISLAEEDNDEAG